MNHLPAVTIQCQHQDGERYELTMTGFPTAHPQLVLTPSVSCYLPDGEWNLTHQGTGYCLGNFGRSIPRLLDLAERLMPFELDFSTPDELASDPQYDEMTAVICTWFYEPEDGPAVVINA